MTWPPMQRRKSGEQQPFGRGGASPLGFALEARSLRSGGLPLNQLLSTCACCADHGPAPLACSDAFKDAWQEIVAEVQRVKCAAASHADVHARVQPLRSCLTACPLSALRSRAACPVPLCRQLNANLATAGRQKRQAMCEQWVKGTDGYFAGDLQLTACDMQSGKATVSALKLQVHAAHDSSCRQRLCPPDCFGVHRTMQLSGPGLKGGPVQQQCDVRSKESNGSPYEDLCVQTGEAAAAYPAPSRVDM